MNRQADRQADRLYKTRLDALRKGLELRGNLDAGGVQCRRQDRPNEKVPSGAGRKTAMNQSAQQPVGSAAVASRIKERVGGVGETTQGR